MCRAARRRAGLHGHTEADGAVQPVRLAHEEVRTASGGGDREHYGSARAAIAQDYEQNGQ